MPNKKILYGDNKCGESLVNYCKSFLIFSHLYCVEAIKPLNPAVAPLCIQRHKNVCHTPELLCFLLQNKWLPLVTKCINRCD